MTETKFSAAKYISIADHMLTQTYPFVQDPKLLVAVVDNLYSAINASIDVVLEFERKYKRIPPYSTNLKSRIDLLREHCTQRYSIKADQFELMEQLSIIMDQHKKSAVEFSRKDTFVICADNYRMKTINIDNLKKFVKETKILVHQLLERATDGRSPI